jgi:nucleoside-diphosphate-sugar epimerase
MFISSPDVYGNTSEMSSISENDFGYLDPLALRSCYGESKRMGEALCAAWQSQNKTPVKIVRPFHVYGPGMNLNDGRVFSDFVSNVVNKQNILIKGQGAEYRTFCYLADAVLAIFVVLFFGKEGEAYNIGNDKCEIQIRELAQLLVKLFPQYKLKVVFAKQKNSCYLKSPNKRGYPDTSKIKQLNWHPQYSLEEGFKRTIKSFL